MKSTEITQERTCERSSSCGGVMTESIVATHSNSIYLQCLFLRPVDYKPRINLAMLTSSPCASSSIFRKQGSFFPSSKSLQYRLLIPNSPAANSMDQPRRFRRFRNRLPNRMQMSTAIRITSALSGEIDNAL